MSGQMDPSRALNVLVGPKTIWQTFAVSKCHGLRNGGMTVAVLVITVVFFVFLLVVSRTTIAVTIPKAVATGL